MYQFQQQYDKIEIVDILFVNFTIFTYEQFVVKILFPWGKMG